MSQPCGATLIVCPQPIMEQWWGRQRVGGGSWVGCGLCKGCWCSRGREGVSLNAFEGYLACRPLHQHDISYCWWGPEIPEDLFTQHCRQQEILKHVDTNQVSMLVYSGQTPSNMGERHAARMRAIVGEACIGKDKRLLHPSPVRKPSSPQAATRPAQ